MNAQRPLNYLKDLKCRLEGDNRYYWRVLGGAALLQASTHLFN